MKPLFIIHPWNHLFQKEKGKNSTKGPGKKLGSFQPGNYLVKGWKSKKEPTGNRKVPTFFETQPWNE